MSEVLLYATTPAAPEQDREREGSYLRPIDIASLNSRLESHKEEGGPPCMQSPSPEAAPTSGTSGICCQDSREVGMDKITALCTTLPY